MDLPRLLADQLRAIVTAGADYGTCRCGHRDEQHYTTASGTRGPCKLGACPCREFTSLFKER